MTRLQAICHRCHRLHAVNGAGYCARCDEELRNSEKPHRAPPPIEEGETEESEELIPGRYEEKVLAEGVIKPPQEDGGGAES